MAETDLLQRILALSESVEGSYIELGRLLKTTRDTQAFLDWGYATFEVFGEAVLHYKPRKMKYLIRVVELVERCGVTPDERRGIGWYKLLLMEKVLTAENKADWLDLAKRSRSEEISHAVSRARGFPVPDEPRRSFSILLQADQHLVVETALELGLKVAGTESRAIALTAMAQEALSSWSPLVAEEQRLAGERGEVGERAA